VTTTSHEQPVEKHLQLCTGCKVMLKRNMNVDAGLVNGSVGTVVALNMSTQHNRVNSVAGKFDKMNTVVNINVNASFEVLKSIYNTRKQFPLMLAFAITIHKSQGLSLTLTTVDADSTNFGAGMVYVALSRVTSLDGLHLIDFDKSKVVSDKKAVVEYNRLRRLYKPHLGELSVASTACQSGKLTANGKRGKKRKHDTNQHTNSLHSPLQPDKELDETQRKKTQTMPANTCSENNLLSAAAVHSSQHNSHVTNMNGSSVASVDDSFQTDACGRLNLQLFHALPLTMTLSRSAMARQLERHLHLHLHLFRSKPSKITKSKYK